MPLSSPIFYTSCHMPCVSFWSEVCICFFCFMEWSCCTSGSVSPILLSVGMQGFGQAIPVEAAELGGTLWVGAVPASGAAGCGCPHPFG